MLIKIPKEYVPIILIPLAALCASLPSVIFGQGGSDLNFHTVNSIFFREEILSGNFYPRWLKDINAGCGQGVFYFYPPLSYYIYFLFSWLKDLPPSNWRYFSASFFFVLCLIGWFCYLWLKELIDEKAALGAAIMCIFLPYNNILNFYSRFSFPEITAFTFTIIALYFATKFAKKHHISAFWFVIAQTMIILSNLPATIVLFFVAPFFYLLLQLHNNFLLAIAKIFLIILASLLLSSFFTLPLFDLINYVHVGNKNSPSFLGEFNFYRSFFKIPLYSSVLIQFYICLALFFSSTLMIIKIIKYAPCSFLKNLAIFIFIIEMISIFIMSKFSYKLWELLPLLQKIQFPWRFLNIQGICFVIISGIYLHFHRENTKKAESYFYTFFIIFIVFFIDIIAFSRFSLYSVTQDNRTMFMTDFIKQSVESFKYKVLQYPAEYLPITSDMSILNIENLEKLSKLCKQKISANNHKVHISIKQWSSGFIKFNVNSTEESEITTSQFYFPLWQAVSVHDPNKFYQLEPTPYYGLIKLNLEKGNHDIILSLKKTPHQQMGEYLSLATLMSLIVFYMYLYKKNYANKNS